MATPFISAQVMIKPIKRTSVLFFRDPFSQNFRRLLKMFLSKAKMKGFFLGGPKGRVVSLFQREAKFPLAGRKFYGGARGRFPPEIPLGRGDVL